MSEILAFTAESVCRLTGLSPRQLGYWDQTDFFSPELLDEFRRRAFGRIYSFRDVVGLRTIAILRNKYRIPRAGFAPLAIIREYPRLTPLDVQAAIQFESDRQTAA